MVRAAGDPAPAGALAAHSAVTLSLTTKFPLKSKEEYQKGGVGWKDYTRVRPQAVAGSSNPLPPLSLLPPPLPLPEKTFVRQDAPKWTRCPASRVA